MVDEWQIWKDLEGSYHGLNKVLFCALPGQTEEYCKISHLRFKLSTSRIPVYNFIARLTCWLLSANYVVMCLVTRYGVWVGNWICWTLMTVTTIYNLLWHTLSLLYHLCLHQSLLGNGSQHHRFLSFCGHIFMCCQLSHTSSWLQLLTIDF
jgi:hypothetical protein